MSHPLGHKLEPLEMVYIQMILNSFSDNWIVLDAIVCLIVELILGYFIDGGSADK
jgi:hypothetical protein